MSAARLPAVHCPEQDAVYSPAGGDRRAGTPTDCVGTHGGPEPHHQLAHTTKRGATQAEVDRRRPGALRTRASTMGRPPPAPTDPPGRCASVTAPSWADRVNDGPNRYCEWLRAQSPTSDVQAVGVRAVGVLAEGVPTPCRTRPSMSADREPGQPTGSALGLSAVAAYLAGARDEGALIKRGSRSPECLGSSWLHCREIAVLRREESALSSKLEAAGASS